MTNSEKTRLINVLEGKPVDRVPVICPGGMMNMAVREVMTATGRTWPRAHIDPKDMAMLSLGVKHLGGIENVGVPFCMTVEAEALGAGVFIGTESTEPRVAEYPLKRVEEWENLPSITEDHYRVSIVLEAIRILKEKCPETPVIGNITGPISLATSLIEPMDFYRALRRKPDTALRFLDFVTDNLIFFAKAMLKAGADIINIADPSGTGEILGPWAFSKVAVPYINKITDAVEASSGYAMVHICGRLGSVLAELGKLKSPVISIDALTGLRKVKESLPDKVIMGNVSTFLLEKGTPEKVAIAAVTSIKQGAGILAPACGISPRTPLENIRAMVRAAKGERD
ncbi:methylcobamide:CoM methyltransferase MtbA [Thermosediminibacter oceani]|uniref:Methyltransferase MtaA/CmuA family n=1 Tax=Thermosediminibacter oceani (strain ATCC BAA-1034 / DSM 16646 / JW/IW-1228P) TaxID=555079 RepID=D9S249_THEOJ|nr:methylcobamide:CoM methyltransferase MtbA [Thermosediminibacter oceani]ADL07476.1 methyltransferase MtaA/CmuA family [Thermosediminibacter oceani DSM 16646]